LLCTFHIDEPRNIAINVTHTVDAIELACSADGNPAPVYQWTDLTSDFTSNYTVVSLKAGCSNAHTTLTCTAVGHNGVSVTENVSVNWTYSECSSKGKRNLSSVVVIQYAAIAKCSIFFVATVKINW